MMGFTYSTAEKFKQPILQYIGSKGIWIWRRHIYRLVEDYYFEWGPEKGRKRWYMKKGFEFDKASKPKFGALIGFTTDGETDGASMLHDRLFRDRFAPTPGDFEFQTRVKDEWVADNSRWKKGEANDLYEYMSVCAGYPEPAAGAEKFFVTIWPPNWFK